MTFIFLLIFVICLAYSLLIIYYTIGWVKAKKNINYNITPKTFISVVVSARNEEKNIKNLLDSIHKQIYTNFELIIIDDHSKDNTVQIIENFNFKNCSVLKLNDNQQGKKEALYTAISKSKGELIVTTDADCIMGKNWLYNIATFFQQEKAEFIIGPVKQTITNNFFQNLFSLDFLSLQAAGAGATELQNPFMCNGANLAFTKNLWKKTNIIEGQKYASGDDVFFLHTAINIILKKSIRFLFSEDAIISTNSPANISEFFKQRIRWASKAKGYKNKIAILTSFIILMYNLLLLCLLTISPFSIKVFYGFILTLSVKLIIDFPILYISSKFYGQKKLLWFYLPLQLIYYLYLPIIAVLSLIKKYKWKGRVCDNINSMSMEEQKNKIQEEIEN